MQHFFIQWQCECFVVYFTKHHYLRRHGVAGDWRITSNLVASDRSLMEASGWTDRRNLWKTCHDSGCPGTPQSRILLDDLTTALQVKIFLDIYRNITLITVTIRTRYWTLPRAKWVLFTPSSPTRWNLYSTSVIILTNPPWPPSHIRMIYLPGN
jgi:hypothetical protein